MQLADRSTTVYISATDSASPMTTGVNQQAYQRLKLALSLNLRRQIFLAVCDDLALRNRIAARLYAELAYPAQKSGATQSFDRRIAYEVGDNQLPDDAIDSASASLTYPRLVSLNLNMSDPNPMLQTAEWLAQYPPPLGIHQHVRAPGFQILGTERLTRQPAPTQSRFLNSLQQIEQYLPGLDSALLLWLPRPWLHAVQQSAPNFWNWHTALFEFEGDPTPVPVSNPAESVKHSRLTALNLQEIKVNRVASNEASQLQNVSGSAISTQPEKQLDEEPAIAPLSASQEDSRATELAPKSAVVSTTTTESTSSKENVWQILAEDLAHLDHQTTDPSDDLLNQQQFDLIQAVASEQKPPPQAVTFSAQEPTAEVEESNFVDQALAPADSTLASSSALSVILAADQLPEVIEPVAFGTAHLVESPPAQSQFATDLADLVLTAAAKEPGGATSGKHTQPIQILQQIEQLHLKQASPATLATAYQSFGSLYRDRIEQGDISEQTLVIAICAYEHALEWLEDSSPLWSDILNDVGNLYWMRSRSVGNVEQTPAYLEQAIATYQRALAATNPETRPHSYAMIQNNLGSAYGDFARYRDSVNMLQGSIHAYEAALRYRTFEDDPARYAATQNNLGTTYWNLAQHQEPVRCLKLAIAAYCQALRYYSREQEPMNYAMIQNNLGTAYWNLAQQEQAIKDAAGQQNATSLKLLLRAITAYHAALEYRTLEVAPTAYAATQNNLGTAHWHIANLSNIHPAKRREQLQQAISAYKSALAAVQYLSAATTSYAPPLTFDQFATYNNLGLAYYQLATDKQKQEDESTRSSWLESALVNHSHALQGWQQQPDLYQSAFSYVIQTVRTFHEEFGIKGQSLALSKIPANILPEVMKRL